MSLSQTSVAKLYASVIDDVIGGVREFFIDEGVDEQVLNELKDLWERKLRTSQAVEVPKPEPEPQPPLLKNSSQQKSADVASSQAASGVVNLNNLNNKTISIQITLPGTEPDSQGRPIIIDVPSSAIRDNKINSVLTGPVISATMALPANLATSLLQQHVNAAFQGHTSSTPVLTTQTLQAAQSSVPNGTSTDASQRKTFPQQDGVPQLDGVRESSDEEDDDNDDNDDEEDNDDDDEEEDPDAADENAEEEDPLNSGDDVSEEDPGDMFETDNVVVCQYDKITRSRNRWKFYLKDGIMHLGGKDFVFQKSSGDAEW